MQTRQFILILLLCIVVSALSSWGIIQWLGPQERLVIRESTNVQPVSQHQDWLDDIPNHKFLSAVPTEFTTAAAAATPAVVFIRSYETRGGLLFGRRQTGTASTGSGVIIGPDGYIITNNHVIEGGTHIEVTLANKQLHEATIVGTDPSTDLALLKIDATQLPSVQLGDSDSLLVGEWVLAVGNPFNLESTVTAGIVSAKGRNIDILEGQDRIESFIQTDAVVNPGNSGGALVNTKGELVGINTAIITRSGGYEGYSFAVPVNLVRKIVRDLREYGSVQRGLLGVFIQEVDASTAAQLGLDEVAGVMITRITENSGADNAGLQTGDVITGINGIRTNTAPSLQEILGQLRPGNEVRVDFIREGRARSIDIVLKNKLNSTSPLSAKEERLLHDLGFELRNLSDSELGRLSVKGGAKVISVFRGSTIGQTNMEPGFVITGINERTIKDVEQLLRRLKNSRGEVILKGIYEHYEGEYFYAFQMP